MVSWRDPPGETHESNARHISLPWRARSFLTRHHGCSRRVPPTPCWLYAAVPAPAHSSIGSSRVVSCLGGVRGVVVASPWGGPRTGLTGVDESRRSAISATRLSRGEIAVPCWRIHCRALRVLSQAGILQNNRTGPPPPSDLIGTT